MAVKLALTLAAILTLASGDTNDVLLERLTDLSHTLEGSRLIEGFKLMASKDPRLDLSVDERDYFDTCQGCIDSFQALINLYNDLGVNIDQMNDAFKILCKQFDILSDDGCDGVIDAFAPILEYVYIEDGGRVPPEVVCVIMQGENKCEGTASLEEWSINIDANVPAVEDKVMPENGMPTQKVLHISDFHIDLTYTPGAKVECEDEMCCSDKSGMAEGNEEAAGYWGEYICDMPQQTVENILDHIAETHPDIDFILMTGDFPAHDIYYQSNELNLNSAEVVINLVKEKFPTKTVLASMGNHEAFPCNSFPVTEEFPDGYDISWLYNGLAELYSDWLTDDAIVTFKDGGYFSTQISSGLRFISINSMYCLKENFWLGLDYKDPMGQLQWLQDELFAAETAGDKAWILSHVPPGSKGCISNWGREYTKIIERYENTVVNQFFGHTHKDEFIIFYDTATQQRPTSVGFFGPSLTPHTNLNLAYKIYTVDGDYDGSTRRVIDYETYIGDLSEAGDETQPPPYSLLYNARQDLELDELLPANYDDLIRRIRDDDEIWQKMYKYYITDSPVADEPTQDERENLICRFTRTDRADESKCIAIFNECVGECDETSGANAVFVNSFVMVVVSLLSRFFV